MEIEIGRHLINGEKLEDKFMDYCLRHLAGSNMYLVNMKSKRTPSVFDKIPAVKNFTDYIANSKDQKILSVYGDSSAETGIIKGDCEFHLNKSFRYLYVPIEQLFVFSEGKWNKGKIVLNSKKEKQVDFGNYLYINPDVFFDSKYPSYSSNDKEGKIWTTNYSKQRYIGGQRPKETQIYIGNKLVEDRMLRSIFVTTLEDGQGVEFISSFD